METKIKKKIREYSRRIQPLFFAKKVIIEDYEHPQIINRALDSNIADPLDMQLQQFKIFYREKG